MGIKRQFSQFLDGDWGLGNLSLSRSHLFPQQEGVYRVYREFIESLSRACCPRHCTWCRRETMTRQSPTLGCSSDELVVNQSFKSYTGLEHCAPEWLPNRRPLSHNRSK